MAGRWALWLHRDRYRRKARWNGSSSAKPMSEQVQAVADAAQADYFRSQLRH
jgi:hypothetical protein